MRQKTMIVTAAILLAAAKASAQEVVERRVVVSLPDCKAALIEGGKVIKIYPVAVGAPSTPTPTGTFQIVHRIPNPTWYKPGKIVPPGKANPLGTRWLGLSRKGYGIHGTNSPRSIGERASSGCIRMKNRDVEELFEFVQSGDVVELHGERDAELERIFSAQEPLTVAMASVQ